MRVDWHRLVGVSIADVVTGCPFDVVTEMELAKYKKRLDIAVIRRPGDSDDDRTHWPDLPDGLTDLVSHNLLTYRSIHDSLSMPIMWELLEYWISYAKETWSDKWDTTITPPAKDWRLYAVATVKPNWLRPDKHGNQRQIMDGIYEVDGFDLTIRVIVPREVVLIPRNSMWHVFSGIEDRVAFGMRHYEFHDGGLYNVLNVLAENYEMEGIEMPYTIEDFKRDSINDMIEKHGLAEVLQHVSPADRVSGLSLEDRLEGLPQDFVEACRRMLEKDAGPRQ